jgi:hypothetical protein
MIDEDSKNDENNNSDSQLETVLVLQEGDSLGAYGCGVYRTVLLS